MGDRVLHGGRDRLLHVPRPTRASARRIEMVDMATRKQKLRAEAAGSALDQPAKAAKKSAKAKKTSRGK